ncbi:LysE family transporter [Herbiconiux ginsengi]|uniref:Threonine/homoserine/homoserine lactone efflux protein n=1 Tax=Herbiconiux ginsengi TaxID=381665 RepID=A0A1H3S4B0_9MICO|nr:LysE family transporter [Herbiconiux ginsengi]SDZ31999.1 Threonine/homoserine/homoserine lactone efflux protein [Herbiconiux ginsengi]
MDWLLPFASGLVAGLALAAPLGAIGVLLIQEGIARGLRHGLPAAGAVAAVDTAYCAIAVIAGVLVGPIVRAWEPWPQIVGGAALVVLGGYGLIASRRSRSDPGAEIATSSNSVRHFGLFLALTAINPATLVYFAALLPGLEQIATSAPAKVAFVAGVGLASFGWQALLIALGAGLRRKATPSFRRVSAVIGNGVVALLGVLLIVRAL